MTVATLATPMLRFGYREPTAHLVLDTIDSCVAILVAYLLYGRFVRTRRLQDFLLLQGLVLLAAAGLLLRALMSLMGEGGEGRFEVWLPLAVRVAAALLIAGASLSGHRRLERRGWEPWCLLPSVSYVALLAGVLWAVRARLPVALDPSLSPLSGLRPAVVGHPLLITAQVVSLACFLVAAVSFTQIAQRGTDELLRWLGPACAVAVFARLNYVLFPSIYSDWLYVGDLLRVAFYLLLLVGAAREIRQYWSRQTQAAVLKDRRRVARELHDGVVQELGYIRLETAGMSGEVSRVDRILRACDRAVAETRGAIDALVATGNEPLAVVLDRSLGNVAHRQGVQLVLRLDPAVDVDATRRHALVRIAWEAVFNAARHGTARTVTVTLDRDAGAGRLLVEDDGSGFDVATIGTTATGHGLISMRERAQALPGELCVDSAPGAGTTVTVRW